MRQLVLHHASPFARRCFEGSIVFTGVVGILISLSLEIPCACCGLCWTVPTPTAPRHFFPLFCFLHIGRIPKSRVMRGNCCIFTRPPLHFNTQTFSPSFSPPLLFFPLPSPFTCFQVSLFLSSGCQLWVTLPGDESVYSLSSKDEWFHYNGGGGKKKGARPISGN